MTLEAPWSTLFAGYEEHWLLGQYLKGRAPNWDAVLDDPQLDNLSSGERALLSVALLFRAYVPGSLRALDAPHRVRVAQALLDLP